MPLSLEDRKTLIRTIQAGVPLEPRPFASIAKTLGSTEGASDRGTCANSNARRSCAKSPRCSRGICSATRARLQPARSPRQRIERVAEIVNAHPTVSHNYLRDHSYNLWFTIAVAAGMMPRANAGTAREGSGCGWLPRTSQDARLQDRRELRPR